MRISIIIPAYNAAPFLARSVASIAGQQYGEYEIIIVDDGSTDETRSIAERMASTDTHIHVIHQENRGVSAARNKGLSVATGDYVLFLDADDSIRPGLFREALETDDHPACILYGFDYIYVDHAEEHLPSLPAGDHSREEALCVFWQLYRDGSLSNIGTKIYRRDLLALHRIQFNEEATILEDASFCLMALQYAECIRVLGRSYYNYYMDANAASIQKRYRPDFGEHLNQFFVSAQEQSVPKDQEMYLVYMDAILLVLRNDLLDPDASRLEILARYRDYMEYPLVIASRAHIRRPDVRPIKYLFYQLLWRRHPALLYRMTVLWSKMA